MVCKSIAVTGMAKMQATEILDIKRVFIIPVFNKKYQITTDMGKQIHKMFFAVFISF